MTRACPVCGAFTARSLHRASFVEGSLGEGYDVVVCNACGAGYADGIPDQAVLDRYYAEQSKYVVPVGHHESPYDLARFSVSVEHLIPWIAREAHILDIGCSTGGLLSVFKQKGFLHLHGIDPSPGCAEAALRMHNVTVEVAAFSQLSDRSTKYDLVLSLGVLEHVRELADAMETFTGLLNDNGFLYIAVPDVEGFAECFNAPFQQFSMEHVNFFSANSLANVAAIAGLSLRASWRNTLEWRKGVFEPVLAALFCRGEGAPVQYDGVTEKALRRYIAASAEADNQIARRIDAIVASGDELVVWGAGALARRLLQRTRLRNAKIFAFIDSNPNYIGKSLAGRPILPPESVRNVTCSILICSVAFQDEIKQCIVRDLGVGRPIICL